MKEKGSCALEKALVCLALLFSVSDSVEEEEEGEGEEDKKDWLSRSAISR